MSDDLDQRQPRVRESAYLGWTARLFCLPCLALHGIAHKGVEVCHIRMSNAEAGWRNPGMQQKPDDRKTFPACPKYHRLGKDSQHDWGDEGAWWEWLGVDPFAFVAALNAAYDARRDGNAVVALFAARARKAKDAAVATARVPLDPA